MIAPVQLCVDAHAQKNDGFLFANGYFEINSVHVKCVVSGNFTFCKFAKWNFYLEHIKSEFGRFVGYWTCFVRWVSFDFSNFHGKLNPRMRRNAHNLCGLTSTHTHTSNRGSIGHKIFILPTRSPRVAYTQHKLDL